jgi:hypothetical protein
MRSAQKAEKRLRYENDERENREVKKIFNLM